MKKQLISALSIAVRTLFSLGIGVLFPLLFPIGTEHTIKLVVALGEAATVLFGVFGVWLGICYRDNIETMTAGKSGDELKRIAEEVADRAERCEVLIKGLGRTSFVFIFSLLVRSFEPAILVLCQKHWIVERLFCISVFISVILLIFGILSPVVIMLHAMEKVRQAADSADETLRLSERSDVT